MNNKIRFGVIGTNNITDWFLSGAKEVKDFELTAVYSRTEKKARSFADKYGVENIFTSLEEMTKSNLIDAVYIASPNSLHASQSILFLENKKHVLCEKAFASNASEAEKMIKASKENGVVLMEAMKTTALPNFKVIEENIHKIGKVRKYFASFCQYSSRYDAYRQGEVLNAFKPEFSNGALMDIGVYCIAPMVSLFGEPLAIQATGFKLASGVDGEGSILCTYPEMTAVVQYSKISNSDLPTEIQGEEGTITINKISQVSEVTFKPRQGDLQTLGSKGTEDDLYDETQDFVEMILADNQEQRDIWLAQSRSVMRIMDEARRQLGISYPSDYI